MALPAEYDTVLGRSFNNSCELSRGQWQRLAIARGAVGRVPILVLDEPSAWLDPEAEDRLLDHWAELVGDSACLLVSHRMSCVRRADRIVFIENGRVAEAGTHDQLVRLGGRYARVFARQARRYGGVEAAVPGGINEMGAV
jgi:ATP-binding cassette subfamily B protein